MYAMQSRLIYKKFRVYLHDFHLYFGISKIHYLHTNFMNYQNYAQMFHRTSLLQLEISMHWDFELRFGPILGLLSVQRYIVFFTNPFFWWSLGASLTLRKVNHYWIFNIFSTDGTLFKVGDTIIAANYMVARVQKLRHLLIHAYFAQSRILEVLISVIQL